MEGGAGGGWSFFFLLSSFFIIIFFLFSLSLSAAACVLRPSLGGAGKRAQERERGKLTECQPSAVSLR